jgi:HlyD family secretion protein
MSIRFNMCRSSLLALALTALVSVIVAQAPLGPGAAPAIRIATIHPVEKSLSRLVEQPAQVDAYAVAPLYAKVSGYVDKVHVEIGQTVKAGKVLVSIASPELQAELKQKQALVLQAAAVVEQAQSAIEVAQYMEQTAQAQTEELAALVQKAKAETTRYKSEFERMTQLAASNAVPNKVRDEVQSQYNSAEANVTAATAKLKTGAALIAESKAKSLAAKADLRAAEAKRAVADADVEQTKALLAYTEMAAPFDGSISHRAVDQGHLVSGNTGGNAKPLIVIVQTDRLRVTVDVPEIESGYLASGNPVTMRFPALSNQTVTAKVTRVAAAIDADTRTLRAEIELDNAESKLRPGLFAHAVITVAQREKCLVLPTSAILVDAGKSYCLCVRGGVITRTPLELGLRAGSEIEVISGITVTDDIVPKNPANYTAGQAAEVIPPAAK